MDTKEIIKNHKDYFFIKKIIKKEHRTYEEHIRIAYFVKETFALRTDNFQYLSDMKDEFDLKQSMIYLYINTLEFLDKFKLGHNHGVKITHFMCLTRRKYKDIITEDNITKIIKIAQKVTVKTLDKILTKILLHKNQEDISKTPKRQWPLPSWAIQDIKLYSFNPDDILGYTSFTSPINETGFLVHKKDKLFLNYLKKISFIKKPPDIGTIHEISLREFKIRNYYFLKYIDIFKATYNHFLGKLYVIDLKNNEKRNAVQTTIESYHGFSRLDFIGLSYSINTVGTYTYDEISGKKGCLFIKNSQNFIFCKAIRSIRQDLPPKDLFEDLQNIYKTYKLKKICCFYTWYRMAIDNLKGIQNIIQI